MKKIILSLFFALFCVAVSNAFETERGVASWYGPGFHGRTTANGETYDMNEMTAAHKSLPFDTRVRVVDLDTGKSVIVRINDRGPFVAGRIIDLSYAAAQALGMEKRGTARVELQILSENESPDTGISGYYIQAGSFSQKSNAIRQMNTVWKRTGFKPQIFVSGSSYRLIMGPWKKKKEAELILERMKRKGLDGMITHGSPHR